MRLKKDIIVLGEEIRRLMDNQSGVQTQTFMKPIHKFNELDI